MWRSYRFKRLVILLITVVILAQRVSSDILEFRCNSRIPVFDLGITC
jgi:hypothetical protein